MNYELSSHYKTYYEYPLPDGIQPGEAVAGLFDQILQEDRDSQEQVIRILSSNTYYLIVDRLAKYSNPLIDDIDNIMQDVRMQIMTLFFRGIPERITRDGFYGFLLQLVENRIKNYQREKAIKLKKEQRETPERSLQEVVERQQNDESADPENAYLMKERWRVIRKVVHYYLEALQETELPPHYVLTYCYAVLVPQLFKKSKNIDFLRRVEQISKRNEKTAKSWYNEKDNCLEGEIARDSVILMKWAYDAMKDMQVSELEKEFLELYQMEPLNEEPFSWGTAWKENMRGALNDIPLETIVILEHFTRNAIKNWPLRVAEHLMTETERRIHADCDFCRESIEIVENLIGREG